MPLSLEEVEFIAELARLDLSPLEKDLYRLQLSTILDYFTRLQALDAEGVAPTSSVLAAFSGLREDNPKPGLTLEELLHNAPETEQGQFRVPPVFD